MNSIPTIPRKPRRHAILWIVLIPLHFGFLLTGFPQGGLPDLAQIKAAAETGNAQAQDKLAGNYLSHFNFSAAAEWYEKAAKQGVQNSQWQLGQILLHGEPKLAEGSVAVPPDKPTAIRWLLLAANQGHSRAQVDLGRCHEKGDGVPQDYVEAYKWYRLASQPTSNSLLGKITLDPLILKMSPQQIQEGQKRAGSFSPGRAQVQPPSASDKLVLKGISGPAGRRLAVINDKTLAPGEQAAVKAGVSTITVRCVEIRETSVLVRVEGLEGVKELRLKQ